MSKHHAKRLLVSGLLLWMTLGICDAAEPPGQTTAHPDPRLDMIAALQSMGPHSSLGNQATVFGRLVGTWMGEYVTYSKDGKSTSHDSGKWIFGWVLDGRAMQDLLIFDPPVAGQERYVGTTLRYFDPASGTWSATYVDPENNFVATLTGRAVAADRIELSGPIPGGKQARWWFEDIRPASWVFRGEISDDGGKTWRLKAEYHMRRPGTVRPSH